MHKRIWVHGGEKWNDDEDRMEEEVMVVTAMTVLDWMELKILWGVVERNETGKKLCSRSNSR